MVPYGFEQGPDKIGQNGKVTRTLVPCELAQEVIALVDNSGTRARPCRRSPTL